MIFRNVRISTKLFFTILPLIVAAFGTTVYLNNHYQEEEMLRQAQTTAQTYSTLIRESLVQMMVSQERIDDNYLARLNKITDVRNVHIHFMTENLHLREMFDDSIRLDRLHRRERALRTLSDEELHVFATGEPLWKRNDSSVNAIIPFKAEPKCQQCHNVPVGHVLAAAEMNVSLSRISTAIASNWQRTVWVFLFFAVFTIMISIIFYRLLVQNRLKHLVDATQQFGKGTLDRPVTLGHSQDELGLLARSFDNMRSALKAVQEKLIHTERLSTIGQMASSIVHDFRTPMTNINLAIQSIQRREPENNHVANAYKIIHESIHRMAAMAQELLDFSRGEINLDKKLHPVEQFMDLLERNIKMSLQQANIHLEINKQYSGVAQFDMERLHRAFTNIITNAQDAMPNGGELRIVVTQENGLLRFDITDSGAGIPEEIYEKIFDAFVTIGKKKGTGLGLAITKRIIDQHDGTVQVHSQMGQGTTFTIKIPLDTTTTL